ncbi:PD-(D/E)XK nuclease family transposase [Pullulanibacillus pueri]|uniref:PD-(D/E)XK nuclease family transposase n=1 Tax=Pullulanibacillus pueri TaxID=1437324 RepID=UPI003570CF90
MDLKIDYAFKQLFGNKKNKDITMVFLNAFIKHWRRLQWKMRHFEEHLKIGKS